MMKISQPKKTIHPLLTYGFLIISLAVTIYSWRVLLSPQIEPEVKIVPGDFPKLEVRKETDTQITNSEDNNQTSTQQSPNVLSMNQAAELTVVVNKKYKLPESYAPVTINVRGTKLRTEAAEAIDSLLTDAQTSGISSKIISGYRSYAQQQVVYDGFVRQYGQEQADTFSARPGHSEHQLGLAVDIGNADGNCDLMICFGNTQLGEWLKNNSHLYGFIIRYPEGKDTITGYQYEPWHLRYVGIEVAEKVKRTGVTLDEYFNLPAGDYY